MIKLVLPSWDNIAMNIGGNLVMVLEGGGSGDVSASWCCALAH